MTERTVIVPWNRRRAISGAVYSAALTARLSGIQAALGAAGERLEEIGDRLRISEE